VIESDFKYSDRKIHTTEDKIEYLDFDHMLQHAKFTLGLGTNTLFSILRLSQITDHMGRIVYELAFALL
jgi:hypothetical protein